MDVGTLIPVEEYLATTYHPDCDYIEGQVIERNMGQPEHGVVQGAIFAWFWTRRYELGITALLETRMQVGPRRYRVPDVLVVQGSRPSGPIVTIVPLLCVEVLSPDDRVGRMQERINEYLALGVRYVWMIDPETRQAWVYTQVSIQEVKDGFLRLPELSIAVPLAEIFVDL